LFEFLVAVSEAGLVSRVGEVTIYRDEGSDPLESRVGSELFAKR